ncbi:MAG: DJ-1/PfpI family protein [Treponema sp.]|jgi:4-methyl-5(b-hydroxyethyl)-thiazole monophosphate biosynthesis|nr:DJ-1/PfpI family protein [Treponema sp.]
MSKKALVLLAEGFEEVEAITPINYLKRAGVAVTVASINSSLTVKGARAELNVIADITLEKLAPGACCFDAIIIPGGIPGAEKLAACKRISTLLIDMADAGKLICAICASPAIVLAPLGLLSGKKFTCYPGMEEKVTGAQWSDNRVVTDGNLITSRAAGTSGEFSIAIISALLGKDTAKKIADLVLENFKK